MTIQFHSILQKGINMKQKTSLFSVVKIILCSIAGILVIYSCVQSEEDSEIINTDTNTALIKSESQNKPSKEELYLEARQLLDSKQYDEALAIYDSLGAYKDSMCHAEGIRCIDYATTLANELSYSKATFGIVGGMEWHYEYSPENYTFTEVFEVPTNGLFGILAGLGVAMGEEANYQPDGMRELAEELYYKHFASQGYYYITCAYEVRDHATNNYLIETFSALENIPAAGDHLYVTPEDINRYFNIPSNKEDIHTWDNYNQYVSEISLEFRQAPLENPLDLEDCKALIEDLSKYSWTDETGEMSISINEKYISISTGESYTYKIAGCYDGLGYYNHFIIYDEAPNTLCLMYISTSYTSDTTPELYLEIPMNDSYLSLHYFSTK